MSANTPFRPTKPAENLRILAARLSEHLSAAEKLELAEAAAELERRSASPPAQDSAAHDDEFGPVSEAELDAARVELKPAEPSAAGVEEPQRWNKADHHASCRPTDSSLVWQCGQCGHVAAADDINALRAAYEKAISEGRELAEQVAIYKDEAEAQRILRIKQRERAELAELAESRLRAAERDALRLAAEICRKRQLHYLQNGSEWNAIGLCAAAIDAALSAREGGE